MEKGDIRAAATADREASATEETRGPAGHYSEDCEPGAKKSAAAEPPGCPAGRDTRVYQVR